MSGYPVFCVLYSVFFYLLTIIPYYRLFFKRNPENIQSNHRLTLINADLHRFWFTAACPELVEWGFLSRIAYCVRSDRVGCDISHHLNVTTSTAKFDRIHRISTKNNNSIVIPAKPVPSSAEGAGTIVNSK